jgi:hypothetical protein
VHHAVIKVVLARMQVEPPTAITDRLASNWQCDRRVLEIFYNR